MIKPHVFLLDNVDSFSYNLVDELRTLNYPVSIYRNTVDAMHIVNAMHEKQQHSDVVLVLSPGPGSPASAGCMPQLLSLCDSQFPIIGICLGHQAIIEHLGGRVVRANQVVHGKSSMVTHTNHPIFSDLPQPLPVARYHSLVGDNLPASLDVIAQVDGIPMAIHHQEKSFIGFQFHPESILTAMGSQLLAQTIEFLAQTNSSKGSHNGY